MCLKSKCLFLTPNISSTSLDESLKEWILDRTAQNRANTYTQEAKEFLQYTSKMVLINTNTYSRLEKKVKFQLRIRGTSPGRHSSA